MEVSIKHNSPSELAAKMDAELRALPVRNTPNERRVRVKYSRLLKKAGPDFVMETATILLKEYGYRWHPYELIANHKTTFQHIGSKELEELGKGINSWWEVDAFARGLSGPAWVKGQVSDDVIERWAKSDDRWWRRAALVSTVALNMRSHGGMGDTDRTLQVCSLLVNDYDDMVVKALSWALRELVVHNPGAVSRFLNDYHEVLAARVKREVQNKLATGLKNPGGKKG